jgi:rod shape-determining protein MreD
MIEPRPSFDSGMNGNRRFKVLIFILLVLVQILIHRYADRLQVNVDLIYLILVYMCIKGGFYKSLAAGTVTGLITDYLSGNVMGVFGFSRTFSAFLLNELSRRIDLKNNVFVFLLVGFSMALSNAIANVFFHFILGVGLNLNMVVYQPLLTGLAAVIITGSQKAKRYLDIY